MTALRIWKGAVNPPVKGWDSDALGSNKFTYSEPTVAQLSNSTNVADAGTSISGFDNSIYIEDNTLTRISYPPIDSVFGDGEVVYCAAYVQMDDDSEPVPSVSSSSGDFSIVIGGSATTGVTLLPNEQVAGTNIWRVSGYRMEDAAPSGAHGVIKFTGQSSKGFRVSGYHVYKGALPAYRKTTGAAVYNVRQRTESSTAWPGSHTVKNVLYLHKGAVQPTNIVAAAATPARGGRVRKGTKPKRYIVEIDNQYIEVSNIAEAQAVLMQARDLAEQAAQRDVKTEVVPKPPRIRVKTVSGNDTTSVALKRDIQKTQKAVLAAYRQAAEAISRDREIARMIQKQMREDDEDDAITALLLM